MSDEATLILYFVIFFLGMLATIGYWFGRYYFSTDDEKAEIGTQMNQSDSDK
jgi:hypothetical protein